MNNNIIITNSLSSLLLLSVLFFIVTLLKIKNVPIENILVIALFLGVLMGILAYNNVHFEETFNTNNMSVDATNMAILNAIDNNPLPQIGSSLSSNIDIISQGINVLDSIDTSNNIIPTTLGTRYFVDTNLQCTVFNTDYEKVKRYTIVDEMSSAVYKNSNGLPNSGLLASAYNALNNIGSSDIINSLDYNIIDSNNNKCVLVSMITDQSNNRKDAYITLGEYMKLNAKNPNLLKRKDEKVEGMQNIDEAYNTVQNNDDDKEEEEDLQPIYEVNMNDDFITQFYFASLSVIGLFVFYRMLER